jgi:hypothetical protein
MNSTYDFVEEDFIHETPLSTSNIQDDDNIADPSEHDLVVNPHIDETPITAEQGQIGPVKWFKKMCRILPTPVCRNNLLRFPPLDDPSHKTIAAIYNEQTKLIGWEPFLRGRVSSSWGKYIPFTIQQPERMK